MTIKTSRALTRAAIVEALGYIPADVATVTMADGSPASAGMKFANNATGSPSGFFRSFIGSSSDIIGIALNGTTGFQLYSKQVLTPLDSVTLQGTPGGTVTSTAAEHYPFSITPGNWTLGATGTRMIGINIGIFTLTLAASGAYGACYNIENDVMAIQQTGGAATMAVAGNTRVRVPVVKAGVTVTDMHTLTFTPGAAVDNTGTITNAALFHAPNAQSANGHVQPTNGWTVIKQELGYTNTIKSVSGGDIVFVSGQHLTETMTNWTSTASGTATLKAQSGTTGSFTIDADNASGTIDFKKQGNPLFRIGILGATAASNGVRIEAHCNNTPSIVAETTTGTAGLALSAKNNTIDLYTGGAQLLRQVQVSHVPSANRNITLGGSNGGNPTIGTSAGDLAVSTNLVCTGTLTGLSATAVGAGANTQAFVKASSAANLGIYYGTGAPTFSAAKGSLYSRTDATTATTRLYVNTDGATTWANFTASA